MPNVTVEFSYKRADEDFLLEPTFVNNNTLSLKYKGPDEIKCWINPMYGEVVFTDVSHPTEEDRAQQMKIIGDLTYSEFEYYMEVLNPAYGQNVIAALRNGRREKISCIVDPEAVEAYRDRIGEVPRTYDWAKNTRKPRAA